MTRKEPNPLTEPCAPAEPRQLALIREPASLQLVDSEEMPKLGVLAIEDRARLSDRVLPPGERIDIHLMVVACYRGRVVVDLQAARLEPVRELDVLPGRGRKRCVERIVGEQLPVDGDVRRVEKVERHRRAVLNQFVSELQTVVIDVIHERRDPLAARPARVAEAGDERVVAGVAMRTRVLGEKSRLGNGVVADEDHEASLRKRNAVIARAAGSRVGLRAESDAATLLQNRIRVVARAVVDDNGLELRCVALLLERGKHALQHRDPVVCRYDDREIRHADTPPSIASTCPVMPLASSEIRNAMPAATSSAVMARRIGTS